MSELSKDNLIVNEDIHEQEIEKPNPADIVNKDATLVIMAAGMGSRYGGLKQIDPVDDSGHLIIDFSIFDAIKAGFTKVVFIIKHEIEADFREMIGDRISKLIKTAYVYQEVDSLPEGFELPTERKKPWGTAHAILQCKDVVEGGFAVINADDYYGPHAFQVMYNYLTIAKDRERFDYSMVGYVLGNTLTDHGYVARGVCETNKDDMLIDIHERTRIEKRPGGPAYTEDDGQTWKSLPIASTVSMNLWGFTSSIFPEIEKRFVHFLKQELASNPLKCEYFLPSVVNQLLQEDRATVKVLRNQDRWYGVTYQEDRPVVVAAIRLLKNSYFYPEKLWEKPVDVTVAELGKMLDEIKENKSREEAAVKAKEQEFLKKELEIKEAAEAKIKAKMAGLGN